MIRIYHIFYSVLKREIRNVIHNFGETNFLLYAIRGEIVRDEVTHLLLNVGNF